MNPKRESYIPTTCSTCGMQLKAKPKYAGRALRCPKCKSTNVVPFEVGADGGARAPNQGDGPSSAAPVAAPVAPLVGKRSGNVPQIDDLCRNIYRCFEDAFTRAQSVLADVALTDEKRERELVRIKRDLSASMRQEVVKGKEALAENLTKLEDHPMGKSAAVKAQLEEAQWQVRGYEMFARCVFDLKPQTNGQ